jgi:hypothetical protein
LIIFECDAAWGRLRQHSWTTHGCIGWRPSTAPEYTRLTDPNVPASPHFPEAWGDPRHGREHRAGTRLGGARCLVSVPPIVGDIASQLTGYAAIITAAARGGEGECA